MGGGLNKLADSRLLFPLNTFKRKAVGRLEVFEIDGTFPLLEAVVAPIATYQDTVSLAV